MDYSSRVIGGVRVSGLEIAVNSPEQLKALIAYRKSKQSASIS